MSACHAQRDSESATRLTVAAAANLTDVFGDLGREFTAQTGVEVIFSYGATAQLAQQIENGAPFDLFAAADTKHVDDLVSNGKLVGASRKVYVLGQLALWIPSEKPDEFRELKDLGSPKIHFIALAQPELAPYGFAAVEALKNARLWDRLQSKVVYANSVNMAKQLATSGNADAVFTAYSLVLHERGTVLKIDSNLYHPLDQAIALVTSSVQREAARKFQAFILGPEGRAILAKNGYLVP